MRTTRLAESIRNLLVFAYCVAIVIGSAAVLFLAGSWIQNINDQLSGQRDLIQTVKDMTQ